MSEELLESDSGLLLICSVGAESEVDAEVPESLFALPPNAILPTTAPPANSRHAAATPHRPSAKPLLCFLFFGVCGFWLIGGTSPKPVCCCA